LTHGEDLYLKYKDDPTTFCEIKTIDDTTDHEGKPLVNKKNLKQIEMTTEEVRREFYCDFEAYKYKREDQGGTFVSQLRLCESEGRITHLPYEPAFKVNTYWDVGIVDFTTIWFVQEKQESIDVIDFYINRGKGLEFYLNHLRLRPYIYGRNILPHDMNRRQMPTLDTRLAAANEIAEKLCFAPFELGRKYLWEEMINKVRELLNSSYLRIDGHKCREGINGLYEFDASKRGVHSSSTRCTDITESFCYLAMDAKTGKEKESFNFNYSRYDKVLGDYNPFKLVSSDVINSDYNALEI